MGGRRAKNKQGPPAPYLEVKPDFENSTRRSGGKRKPNVDGANGRPAKKVKPDGTTKGAGKKGGKGKKDEDGDGWEDVDDSGLKSQARCAQCDKYDPYVSLSLVSEHFLTTAMMRQLLRTSPNLMMMMNLGL